MTPDLEKSALVLLHSHLLFLFEINRSTVQIRPPAPRERTRQNSRVFCVFVVSNFSDLSKTNAEPLIIVDWFWVRNLNTLPKYVLHSRYRFILDSRSTVLRRSVAEV